MRNHTKQHGAKEFCMHCLQAFSTEEVLAKHKENCVSINGRQGIQMPKRGSKVQFQDHHKQMPVPLLLTQILKLSQKKYLASNKVQKNLIQTNIINIQQVVMVTS